MTRTTKPTTATFAAPTEAELAEVERARADARREADAATTESDTPCCVCGGAVPAGTGEVERRWRRHTRCELSHAAMLTAVTGSRLSEDDAELLLANGYAATPYWNALNWDSKTPRPDSKPLAAPYAYVGEEVRQHLRRGVAVLERLRTEALAASLPTPCKTGACAWCGARNAMSWHDHGHRWADGSPAPLCGACSEVFDRRCGETSPADWDGQRAALGEALTGVPPSIGSRGPAGLRAFAEVADDHAGGEPWGHLPGEAVKTFRLDQWATYGGRYAPAERRQEVLDRWAAKVREAAALRAEREAREAGEADFYGFVR